MGSQDFKDLDDKFAAAFKMARIQADLSQEAVAERMRELGFEMSQPVIGKIERAQRRVSIGEARALSSVVGESLDAMLRGPEYLNLQTAYKAITRMRQDVITAANRFQSAQQALAVLVDSVKRKGELTEFDDEWAEHYILESLEDVLTEMKRDNFAAGQANRIRTELDVQEDEEPYVPHQFDPESFFGRHQAKFGDEVRHEVDALAWGEIYSMDGHDADG